MKSEFGEGLRAGDATKAMPSRRAVLKAGAWSVPVITLATAAPAAAASTAASITLESGPYDDVEVGDVIPLVFGVTGVTDGTAGTATIADGEVAEWADGQSAAVASVDDGSLIFSAKVLQIDTFNVLVSVGGAAQTFPVIVS